MTASSSSDGVVYLYSASQLNVFNDCQRRWGWEYIAQIKPPPHRSAALGSEVHTVLQNWLAHGQAPDVSTRVGQIAQPGLDFLPPPSKSLEVERPFMVKIGEHYYRGFVDLGFMGMREPTCPGCMGDEYECPIHGKPLPWVVDHKTTGNFMWKKSEEDLRHDIQALLYAKQALDRFDVDEVMLMWLYYRTQLNHYKAEPVRLSMHRDEVDAHFTVIDELAAEADKLRLTVLDPMDLPPNPNHCSAYGGCPHVARCNLSPLQMMNAAFTQEKRKMSMLDKMKARNAQRQEDGEPVQAPKAEPVAPHVLPPEAPAEEEKLSTDPPKIPPKKGKAGKERLQKLREAATAGTEDKPVNGSAVPASSAGKDKMAAMRARAAARKDEDEQPEAAANSEEASDAKGKAKAKDKGKAKSKSKESKTKEEKTEAKTETETETKGKRGRPKGSSKKKTTEQQAHEVFVALFTEAIRGGEERNFMMAERAWYKYNDEVLG